MKIQKNTPAPVAPPATYDLLGLSENEVALIRCFADYSAVVEDEDDVAAAKRLIEKLKGMGTLVYPYDDCFK